MWIVRLDGYKSRSDTIMPICPHNHKPVYLRVAVAVLGGPLGEEAQTLITQRGLCTRGRRGPLLLPSQSGLQQLQGARVRFYIEVPGFCHSTGRSKR